MEYFYGGGGNPDPYFRFRFKVSEVTEEMYHWCDKYPDDGRSFCRWHIEHRGIPRYRHGNYDIVQIESEKPAKLFALLFGDQIL